MMLLPQQDFNGLLVSSNKASKYNQMNKLKQKQSSSKNLTKVKKPSNQFKALYQMTKQNKVPNLMSAKSPNPEKQRNAPQDDLNDSLDKISPRNEQQSVQVDKKQPIGQAEVKKPSWHSRSNSCPLIVAADYMGRLQKQGQVLTKLAVQDESKRTLKKSSTLHRKTNRVHKKFSTNRSQVSQESNTVIVHSLPIEQLSSMLYSMNKERGFRKSGSQANLQKVYTIDTDLYFQTRLQQQIRMYELEQEMKKLRQQTEQVKIKQEVLEKLANKFDRNEVSAESEQSLLMH